MITSIEIKHRAPFVGGTPFGAVGPYERIDGVAIGALDPAHPRNRGIALLDKTPRNATGLVEYRSDFILLRPMNAANGNGRLLYEVNNRGRIMLFANLCAGAVGNQPMTADELGNALPLQLGLSSNRRATLRRRHGNRWRRVGRRCLALLRRPRGRVDG